MGIPMYKISWTKYKSPEARFSSQKRKYRRSTATWLCLLTQKETGSHCTAFLKNEHSKIILLRNLHLQFEAFARLCEDLSSAFIKFCSVKNISQTEAMFFDPEIIARPI